MAPFSFHIRFQISDALRFYEPQLRIGVPGMNHTCVIRAFPNGRLIAEAVDLVLEGHGSPTFDEAKHAGNKAYDALLWAAAQARIGLRAREERGTGGLNDHLRKALRQAENLQILDDTYGLMIYDEVVPTRFLSVHASAHVLRDPVPFIEAFRTAAVPGFEWTEQGRLAMEIYGLSYFEASLRARLLMLVTVLEILAPRRQRSAAEVEHIERLIKATDESNLDELSKKALRSALRDLRKESISSTLRKFVEVHVPGSRYAGLTPPQFINKCYNFRSSIVHGSEMPRETGDFRATVLELDRLIRDVLKTGVGRVGQG